MQARWIDPSMHRASMPLTILVLRHTARESSSWKRRAAHTHDHHLNHHHRGQRHPHRLSQPNIPLTPAHVSNPNATLLYTYQTSPVIRLFPGTTASHSVLYRIFSAFSTPQCTALQVTYLFLPSTDGKQTHTYLYMRIGRSNSTLAFDNGIDLIFVFTIILASGEREEARILSGNGGDWNGQKRGGGYVIPVIGRDFRVVLGF